MAERFALIVSISLLAFIPSFASAFVRDIAFPAAATSTWKDDFHDPRDGGTRRHLGVDIMAPKYSLALAARDATVVYLVSPEASWGYAVTLEDEDGYQYRYLHLNNDTPGTDDGMGGEANAYAPGITIGAKVKRGDPVGWIGDSGNAEAVGAHLHFELRRPGDRVAIDPYESLVVAYETRGISTSSLALAGSGLAPGGAKITKRLAPGMRGGEVRVLQAKLVSLGFLKEGLVTGYYGAATKKAVLAFQRKKGLEAVGYVGTRTRALLNSA